MLDDLQTAIAEAPDSAEPYLVYADWLQAQGDAHGEYIQLMHALERETDATRFLARKQRVDTLLRSHGARWLNGVKVLDAKWRWGFIRKARLEASSLRALLDSRAGRFPRELTLTGHSSSLHVGLEHVPATLTGLRLEPTYRDEQVVASMLPPLQRLALGAGQWVLPGRADSTLRELWLEAPLAHPTLLPFLAAAAPSLQTLHLSELPHAPESVLERGFASLTRLSVVDDLADDVLQWLSRSPLLSQLNHLTVGGPFTDAGLDAVLREFARFSRVAELVLFGGAVSRSLRSMARKQLPQLLLLKQAPPVHW